MAKGRVMLGEELLLKPVKLKALVLGAGLALIGLAGAALADNHWPKCASPYYSNKPQPKTDDSKYCQGSNWGYTEDSKCKCPNPNYKPDQKDKCKSSWINNWGDTKPIYSCE